MRERSGGVGVDAAWSPSRRTWCRTTWVGCVTAGSCRCAAAQRTAATATTRSISFAAKSSCKQRVARSTPDCGSFRQGPCLEGPRADRVGGNASCSCARETARARRSQRRSSNTCQRGAISGGQRRQQPQTIARQRGARDEEARYRHQREPHQAPGRVRRATFRRRDHPVRPGPGSLSRVPVPSAPRALEHRRPRARRSDQPRFVSRVRAHGDRARNAPRIPSASPERT